MNVPHIWIDVVHDLHGMVRELWSGSVRAVPRIGETFSLRDEDYTVQDVRHIAESEYDTCIQVRVL